MGFKVARKHAAKLAMLSLGLGGLLPAVLLIGLLLAGSTPTISAIVALLAVLSHATGILVERWLFFAEARHAVMNYYGG